ncbi:hypothetical protein JOQ06_002981 [Pogonophryne albipinna]|uniref:Uncharacterized protein n=2 Tax=Notothenioidei TaxID=8205 RepID=A0AAD6B5F0_9TELE|nr:hypothetical protein KUCAC02_020894 [Chaenocephalus aceratus]KAJ4938361.1 hypothetical protein JOQ06_002981 [Pogonophryne albipinna]
MPDSQSRAFSSFTPLSFLLPADVSPPEHTTLLHTHLLASQSIWPRSISGSALRAQTQVRHKCIAIPCSAEWKHCGRQVTNLNGARIFRIIQQSHGAAVFPLKIPDAATLESAQHLLGESLLLCV